MSDSAAVPKKWTATQIPSQKGKLAIVTGANSGIGYVTALELARHGADVVLACRSEEKGTEAVKKIQGELKLAADAGKVQFMKLDVSSLESVKAFAVEFMATHDRLDLLINNAGIMAVPHALSVDGFESQFATNHLGHFALTAQLLGVMKTVPGARIVNVSSNLHKKANMDLNEIVTPKEKYKEFDVYANTKLYNLLFTLELNRRLQAAGVTSVIATAAHPGFTDTNLKDPLFSGSNWFVRQILKLVWMLPIVQTSEFGALPSLYAATAPAVKPNDYYGPDGWSAYTGYPSKQEPENKSKSEEHAKKLWEESEKLAQLTFSV